jgi:hypothetical protein
MRGGIFIGGKHRNGKDGGGHVRLRKDLEAERDHLLDEAREQDARGDFRMAAFLIGAATRLKEFLDR